MSLPYILKSYGILSNFHEPIYSDMMNIMHLLVSSLLLTV